MIGSVLVDLSMTVMEEKMNGDTRKILLEVITAQEELIRVSNEAVMKLLNETVEQEQIISGLMCHDVH